jgi:iron complex transport system ATP-binding protein
MIHISDLVFAYQAAPVLQDVSLSIPDNEFVGIIGPNGAGKSTLLKVLAGILAPQSGEVRLRNKSLPDYRRKELGRIIGFVAQEFKSAFNFTAYEIVLMGRYPHLSPFSNETETDRQIIRLAMEETEVWNLRDRALSELSGGERQRVVLASALAQEPQMLLLDEPTTALDIKHQVRFYEILQSLQQRKGMTVVTATHDINLSARYCRRLIVLRNGKIIADDIPEKIINKALMESVYEVEVEIFNHPHDGKPVLVLN